MIKREDDEKIKKESEEDSEDAPLVVLTTTKNLRIFSESVVMAAIWGVISAAIRHRGLADYEWLF